MNSSPTPAAKIRGFKVVPKRQLGDVFRPSQGAFYVLLGRHGDPAQPRERVLFVDYVDDALGACQQRIDALWAKHRILITHVAVKLSRRIRATPVNLTEAYQRALAVQELRHKLNPRFRRL